MDVAMEISRLENQSQTLDSGVEPEDTSRGSTTATERVAEVRNPSTLSIFSLTSGMIASRGISSDHEE